MQRYQLFSNCLEIFADEGGTFVGEKAGAHFRAGMQQGRGEEGLAALGVGGSVYDAAYLCPAEGGGAHRAGLQGDVQCAVVKVLAADGLGGGGERDHLGVGGGVVQALDHIVPLGDDAALPDDDGPYGDLVIVACGRSLAQRLAHESFVLFHHGNKGNQLWGLSGRLFVPF